MKKLQLLLLSLLGLLVWTACDSDDDNLVNPLNPANQVKFQGTIGDERLRATGTSWDAGDAIGVYALTANGTLPSGVYAEKENVKYTTPGTGDFTAASTPIVFPETGALDFVAYYPYQESISEYIYKINVADQSKSAAIDVLYSNNAKGATVSNPDVALQFKHQLSMLVLEVSTGDGVVSLTDLKVFANNFVTNGEMKLADGVVTLGETKGNLTLAPQIEETGKKGVVAAILVPGQDLKDTEIVFTLGGQDYVWSPEEIVLASGKRYTYQIVLSTTGLVVVNPNATIVDWEDANTGTGTVVLEPEEGGGESDYLTVAQLRAKHTGSDVTISDDVKIKAVVISSLAGGNSTSLKNIVVQDETAGIAIRFVDNEDKFEFGDEVEISLKDQQLSAYNGLLQINNLANANVTKVGTKAVTAKEITAAQLLSGDYESQYVAVTKVQVVSADLEKTFATDKHGSINIEAESGETFVMFTSSYATFKGEKVPQGSGTLKGIASVNKDVYQILPTVATDFAGMTGERFGDDNNGGEPGNTVVFYEETFNGVIEEGNTDDKKKLNENGTVTGFDFSEGKYTGTDTDIRQTKTIGAHVWFPAKKISNLKISNISSGYTQIKLTYDMASNGKNVASNLLKIKCNDVDIPLSDVVLGDQNIFTTITLDIPMDDVTTLEFYADETNTSGLRLDNIKLEGVKK